VRTFLNCNGAQNLFKKRPCQSVAAYYTIILLGEIMEKLKSLYDALVHRFKGCDSFWAVQHNTNNKPFKRQCCFCGRREIRRNGEWVANGYQSNSPRNRRF
jgi:hypothetical protein